MSTVLFTVPSDFSYVIAAACGAAMALHLSGSVVCLLRGKYFGSDKIRDYQSLASTKDKRQNQYEIGEIPTLGYPDEGQGRFAKSLSFGDWYRFSRLNRAYLNYTEQVILFVLSILLCGLVWPIPAAWLGLLIMIGRMVYFFGYAFEPTNIVMGVGEVIALLCMFFNYGVFFKYLIVGS